MGLESACPQCGSTAVRVHDVRWVKPPYLYRRRGCQNCRTRYASYSRSERSLAGVCVTIEAPSIRELDLAWNRYQRSQPI